MPGLCGLMEGPGLADRVQDSPLEKENTLLHCVCVCVSVCVCVCVCKNTSLHCAMQLYAL